MEKSQAPINPEHAFEVYEQLKAQFDKVLPQDTKKGDAKAGSIFLRVQGKGPENVEVKLEKKSVGNTVRRFFERRSKTEKPKEYDTESNIKLMKNYLLAAAKSEKAEGRKDELIAFGERFEKYVETQEKQKLETKHTIKFDVTPPEIRSTQGKLVQKSKIRVLFSRKTAHTDALESKSEKKYQEDKDK